jgi:DNA replication and repair protein RecF
VPIQRFTAQNFRCLEKIELELNPQYNLIFGRNASGKTSLLEAISYLGRGKSFRGASTQNLIRHGESNFVLLGKIDNEARESTLGVRNSRDGLEIKIDGAAPAGAAALAESLPLLVVDPDVHNLVGGAPEERRRYIDWIAFHVEHNYLHNWRRFRRTLKQRNAALRDGTDTAALAGWDTEFIDAALAVDQSRREIVDLAADSFSDMAGLLLGAEAGLEYRSGWGKDQDLDSALAASNARDREQGTTHVGPHRGDLRLVLDERQARKVVSRGQQKLLACSLVLTAAELVQTHLERPLLLLLDDPAAELDSESLNRLMSAVMGLGSQVIATALAPDSRLFPEPPAMFHVERGQLAKTP